MRNTGVGVYYYLLYICVRVTGLREVGTGVKRGTKGYLGKLNVKLLGMIINKLRYCSNILLAYSEYRCTFV